MNITTVFPCVEWIDRIPTPTNDARVGGFRPAFTDIRCRSRYHLVSTGCTSFNRRRKARNRASSSGYGSQSIDIIKREFDGFRVGLATFNWFLRKGLAEKLDFLWVGLLTGVEERFGDLSVDVVDEKLDFLSFLSSRIGGGENFSSRRFSRILCFSSFWSLSRSSRAISFFLIRSGWSSISGGEFAHSLLITTVRTHSPKANNTTLIINARPPKAYNSKANIPVEEMSKLYNNGALALKPANGIRAVGCGELMNMMKKRHALHIVISNIG